MRIRALWLDAYGRFSQQVIQFSPGFQVVLGPNEQGKTTIRNFIGDMLYGQKRSANQRLYDASHTLRRPWRNATSYGGRMTYALDNGQEIEIRRNFDKRSELVQVFNRTHGEEITQSFPRLRNQEPAFAEFHLGLGKLVFLNAASIGHMDLQGLGDEDALGQIREKVLSLADSGEDGSSFEEAVNALEERIAAIGRPQAKSKPLPLLRARLVALDAEWEEAVGRHREAEELQTRRRQRLEEIAALRAERAALDDETRRVEALNKALRLRRIETLNQQVEDLQKRCFPLSDARDFPIERTPEAQRQDNLLSTAKKALGRTESELQETLRQLESEGQPDQPADSGNALVADLSEEVEQTLIDVETAVARAQDKLEQTQAQAQAARERQANAARDLAALPDFTKMASNPIEWLQQLATSYEVDCQSREEERRQLDLATRHVEQLREEMAPLHRIFADVLDFNAEVRAYEVESRVREEQAGRLRSRIDALTNARRDAIHEAPRYRTFALVFVPVIVVFAGFALYFNNPGAYMPSIVGVAGFFWSLLRYRHERYLARQAEKERDETEKELQAILDAGDAQRRAIEGLLLASDCGTVRELEALFERYRSAQLKLDALLQTLHEQERRVQEKRYQVERLFEKLQRTFTALGESLENESQVRDVASRAIGRYQEFRDAKRRVNENKELSAQYDAEVERLREELRALQQQDIELSLEVRRQLRELGFRDEQRHASALGALRAYRIRNAQSRLKTGRVEVIQERVRELTRQRILEEEDVVRQTQALARFFEPVGVQSMDEWHALAEKARGYREAWEARTRVLEEVQRLLDGQDLEALRREIEDESVGEGGGLRSLEEIRQRQESLTAELDARQQQAHDLHIAATQKLAAIRNLSEIEEERAEALRRRDQLQFELDAAAYAATLIENVARDKHARIAPRLAELAGTYLKEITDGAYSELFLSRELGITVRIPETASLDDHPERRLSQGTVDQIYLALRLALVGSLSEAGERIPMLLDDPFANYDDKRLLNAMRLLVSLGKETQIILFTCREDVSRAAEAAGGEVAILH